MAWIFLYDGTMKNYERPYGEDLTDLVIGCWKVLKRDGMRPNGKGGTERLWLLECQICTARRHIGSGWLNCMRRKGKYGHGGPITGTCVRCYGMPKGHSGLLMIFRSYQSRANSFGRCFELNLEEFQTLTSQDCHYCGWVASQISKQRGTKSDWGTYLYNGIDRVDNEKGYTVDNCVPCCGICNHAKGRMSYGEFLAYINRFSRIRPAPETT